MNTDQHATTVAWAPDTHEDRLGQNRDRKWPTQAYEVLHEGEQDLATQLLHTAHLVVADDSLEARISVDTDEDTGARDLVAEITTSDWQPAGRATLTGPWADHLLEELP